MRARSLALAMPFALASVGCALLLSLDDHGATTRGDAAADDGATTGDVPPLPACTPAECPDDGTVIYVDGIKGDDASAGTSHLAPKKTINAALRGIAASTKEIHICSVTGGYTEDPITLTQRVSLRGAYDCAAWRQRPEWSFPSFPSAFATTVRPSTSPNNATLIVDGPSIARDTVIEGLRIEGPLNGPSGSVALALTHGGPTIRTCELVGGTSSASASTGVAGVSISDGAGAFELTKSSVLGGDTAAGALRGSYGVYWYIGATAPDAWMHDLVIRGGNGHVASGTGSIGLAIDAHRNLPSTPASGADHLVISGGTGQGPTVGTTGIYVSSSTFTVAFTHLTVDGGKPSNASRTRGVEVYDGTTQIDASAIYAGDSTVESAAVAAIALAAKVELTNSMLHGGGVVTAPGQAYAILLGGLANATIRNDTLVSGYGATTSAVLEIAQNPTGPTASRIDVDDNLFFGDPRGGTIAVRLNASGCSAPNLMSLRSNAFVQMTGALFASNDTGMCAASVADLGTRFPGATSSNFVVAETCSVPADCTVRAGCQPPNAGRLGVDAGACGAQIFAGWTASGYDQLASGWRLADTAPCRIAQSDAGPFVDADFYGAARVPPISIGAHQHATPCAP